MNITLTPLAGIQLNMEALSDSTKVRDAIEKFSQPTYTPTKRVAGNFSGSKLATREDGTKLIHIIQRGKAGYRVTKPTGEVFAL